jgi:signal transduction histidine kinase
MSVMLNRSHDADPNGPRSEAVAIARIQTLAQSLADDSLEEAAIRRTLQRVLRSDAATVGVSCWIQNLTRGVEIALIEGEAPMPAQLAQEVQLAIAARFGSNHVLAPVRAPDGAVRGVIALRTSIAVDQVSPQTFVLLTVLAAATWWLTRRQIGRPLDRLAHAIAPTRRTADIVDLAKSASDRLCQMRRDADIERQVRVRTREAAQSALRLDSHIANTAHELRTPLTSVLASIEMLRDGYASTPEEQRLFLDQARVSGQHMLILLNDLVDRAAVESGKLRIELRDCFVKELLDEAMRVLGPTAAARGSALEIQTSGQEDVAVSADPSRVLQVFFNLVSNALKYSPPQSPVVVRTIADAQGLTIEIADQGIGINSDAAKHLFQRFSRVHDPASSNASGAGIGLHVSKALVEAMGGSIGYRPGENGAGSVFWFRLARAAGTIAPADRATGRSREAVRAGAPHGERATRTP